MRAILLILILAVVALIIAIQTGFLNISQTRGAKLPSVAADNGAVSATGGQTPAFEVQTGSIGVGSTERKVPVPSVSIERKGATVQVPAIEVRPPEGNSAAPAR